MSLRASVILNVRVFCNSRGATMCVYKGYDTQTLESFLGFFGPLSFSSMQGMEVAFKQGSFDWSRGTFGLND